MLTRKFSCFLKLLATLLLPALLLPAHGQAAALYTVTALPDGFNANAINNGGQMAGYLVTPAGESHAALYSGGAVTDLGTLGGTLGAANAINDAGAVTGVTLSASSVPHAFLYTGGAMLDLGAGTNGLGINAAGTVVGQVMTGGGTLTGFMYSSGTLTPLGNLPGGTTGLAADINDNGQIVGESNVSADLHAQFRPTLYSNGVLQDLGTLANLEVNTAQVINNAGMIAGYSEAQDGSLHAVLYRGGAVTDLGSFGGLTLSIGAINEQGTFVGTASSPGDNLGFIYQDGRLVDLNTLLDPALGWQIDGAFGINDAGQIAAHGCRDFNCGAVRLDLAGAVPEPAGIFLLLPGLVALAGTRRRQRVRVALPSTTLLRSSSCI